MIGSQSQNTLESVSSHHAMSTQDEFNHHQPPQAFKSLETAMNQKLGKVFDRIGFLEDALSRVELSQDSMRPLLRMLEQQFPSQKPTASKRHILKENQSNSSSFISQANGLLLDKLTKPAGAPMVNASSNISQDSSMLIHGSQPVIGLGRDELDRMISCHYEQMRAEQELMNRAVSDNLENFINQLENLRHDVFRLQEHQNSNINSAAKSATSPKSQDQIASFKAQVADQMHSYKSKLDLLHAKVDSMDNSYDKRVSNLEAVVTPLIDKVQQPTASQDQLSADLSNIIQSPLFQKAIDERMKAPMQEKTRQISALEKEIIVLKQQQINLNYQSNTSASKSFASNQTNKKHNSQSFNSQQQQKSPIVNNNNSSNALNAKSPKAQTQKPSLQTLQTDLKGSLDDLEAHILQSSESINDRLEDVHRQMGELHSEIKANVELVKEKKRLNASDTRQFIHILGEDVRQFITCMRDELNQTLLQITDRDDRCRLDMHKIQNKLSQCDASKDAKDVQKAEAFKEHTQALQRHMENTSQYLKKEVAQVEAKIEVAKAIVMKELGIDLSQDDSMAKEIREIQEEDEFDDDEDEEEVFEPRNHDELVQQDSHMMLQYASDQYDYSSYPQKQQQQQTMGNGQQVMRGNGGHQQQPFYYQSSNGVTAFYKHPKVEVYSSGRNNTQGSNHQHQQLVHQSMSDYGDEEEYQYASNNDRESGVKDEFEPHRAQKSPNYKKQIN